MNELDNNYVNLIGAVIRRAYDDMVRIRRGVRVPKGVNEHEIRAFLSSDYFQALTGPCADYIREEILNCGKEKR